MEIIICFRLPGSEDDMFVGKIKATRKKEEALKFLFEESAVRLIRKMFNPATSFNLPTKVELWQDGEFYKSIELK